MAVGTYRNPESIGILAARNNGSIHTTPDAMGTAPGREVAVEGREIPEAGESRAK